MSGAVPGAVHKGRAGPARGHPRAAVPQPLSRAAAALAPAPRATDAAAVAMPSAALLRAAPRHRSCVRAQPAGGRLPASEHVAAARPAPVAAAWEGPERGRGLGLSDRGRGLVGRGLGRGLVLSGRGWGLGCTASAPSRLWSLPDPTCFLPPPPR